MSEQGSVDPWIVQEPKAKFEPLPVGFYMGPFKGVEDVKVTPAKPGDTGERWRFTWEVQSGDHKGKVATALTERTINPNKLPGRLIAGLLDRSLQSVKRQLFFPFVLPHLKMLPSGGPIFYHMFNDYNQRSTN